MQKKESNLWNMNEDKTKEVIRYIKHMQPPSWMKDNKNHETLLKKWYAKQKEALSLSTANAMLEHMNISVKANPLPKNIDI